jgi:hypothetical protein
MAHCNLFPGIASVSGKLGKVLFKTFTRPDGSSVTRMYSTEGHHKRRTPPSDRELAQRQRFARIASAVALCRRNGDTRPKKLIWSELARTIQ